MSFLNPVNEPVLRFSSKDAGAPQINYAARVAGDIKAVLKACLVTGYGTKESAGWAVVNEVNHVAEFVSPSVAMSDYRLGIDDTSTSSTTWYYQYQNTRINISAASLIKISNSNYVKNDPGNGWELVITKQGLVFVEIIMNTALNKLVARTTFFSRLKSMFSDDGQNISWFSVGYEAPTGRPDTFFSQSDASSQHYRLRDMTQLTFNHVNKSTLTLNGLITTQPSASIIAPLYLTASNIIVAEQPGCLIQPQFDSENLGGVYIGQIDSRPALYATVARSYHTSNIILATSHAVIVIPLDFWEY